MVVADSPGAPPGCLNPAVSSLDSESLGLFEDESLFTFKLWWCDSLPRLGVSQRS